MRTVFCRLIAPLFPLVAALPCSAAQDGGLPLEPTRHLRFSTDEGTWMSVDVAPDGKALVFDLLGDLYRLPIAGGKASVLTRGMAFDSQPRFSADGQSIVFVSDRSGAENLWLMPADGKGEARQLSHGEDTVFVSPEWAPDGSGIVSIGNFGEVRLLDSVPLANRLAADAAMPGAAAGSVTSRR